MATALDLVTPGPNQRLYIKEYCDSLTRKDITDIITRDIYNQAGKDYTQIELNHKIDTLNRAITINYVITMIFICMYFHYKKV